MDSFGSGDLSQGKNKVDELIKSVVDHLPGYYWWKDLDGKYRGCNQSVSDALGLKDSSKVIGKTDFDLPWSSNAEKMVAHDQKVIDTQKTVTTEELLSTISGESRTFLVTKSPLFNTQGKLVGTVGNSLDITEQKELEQQLKVAVEKSETANKAKTEFIANMSHDLRTPMTGVMGMLTEMGCMTDDIRKVIEGDSDQVKEKITALLSEMQEYTGVAKGSMEELLNLFNEILETVRLESGQVDEEEENFELSVSANKPINLLRLAAEGKGLKLSAEVAQDVPKYVHGLRKSLDRILINLVSNAIKFTDKGSVKIGISVLPMETQQEAGKIGLRISVDDTGMGIPEDKFDAIFEHFSRLTSSYQGVFRGSGLGLYSVKRYVESMKGAIKVESKVGEGSSFILELPFSIVDHADLPGEESEATLARRAYMKKTLEGQDGSVAEQSDQEVKQSESPSGEVEQARVLITEDNTAAALALQRVLKRLHCAVHHAKTGHESVSMARENNYDIIFMDIGLPDISGLEATKLIREFSQVPIVAVTGHVKKAGVCLEVGMQELLAKPATPSSVEAMLHRHVFSEANSKPQEQLDSAVIDWPSCLKMLENNEETAREVLQMCSEGLDASSEIISKGYAEKDFKALRDELHKVRGGVCYLKLPQLERSLREFHASVKAEPQVPEDMERYYEALKVAIKNFQEEERKQRDGGVNT